MTPEERELLTQSIKLAEENNKMLRGIRRSARVASFLRVIYWLIIIGTAFGKIISSLVNDIIMPPIGLLLGDVDFSNLYINLSNKTYNSLVDAQAAGAATINYGIFLNNILEFLIIALVIFLIVHTEYRGQNSKKNNNKEPITKECPYCLSIIPNKVTRCAHCTSELNKTK